MVFTQFVILYLEIRIYSQEYNKQNRIKTMHVYKPSDLYDFIMM